MFLILLFFIKIDFYKYKFDYKFSSYSRYMDDLTTFWLTHKELWFNSVPETDKIVVDNTMQYFNNHTLVKTLSSLGQIIFIKPVFY